MGGGEGGREIVVVVVVKYMNFTHHGLSSPRECWIIRWVCWVPMAVL